MLLGGPCSIYGVVAQNMATTPATKGIPSSADKLGIPMARVVALEAKELLFITIGGHGLTINISPIDG